jgi:hypothetical protein
MRTDRTRRSPRLAALLILLALPIFIGSPFCSDEGGDGGTNGTPPSRTSPEELLTNWFERVYSGQDSILYEEMLDDNFQFNFTEEDANELQLEQPFWGKTSDLKSTGNMFRSPTVGEITLNIEYDPTQDLEYTGDDCTGCREVSTEVTLQVVTHPPGEDELILAVRGRQVFVVKRDPSDTSKWVIFKQIDFELPS